MDIKSLIQSSDSWENYLKFAANMYSYNFSDQIVIYSNFPSATSIASVKQWNAMGRRIIGGEKGTRISGNSVVFDISQTYGREISKWKFTNDYVPFFYDLLNRTNTSDNLIDEESNFSLNVYDFIYTSIGSNKSISGRLNDDLREFTALSATYITLTRTNMLDNSIIEYDFSDIVTYNNDTAELIGTVAVLYSNALLRCAKQTVKTTTPEQIQARKINAENKVEPIIIEDFEDVQAENDLGNLEDFEDITTEVPDEIKNEESNYKTPESQLSETDTTDNSDFNESEKPSESVISINPVTENYSTSLSEDEQMRILDDALMLDNGSIDKAAIKRFYDNNNRRDVVVSYIKHAYHNKALKTDNTDYPCVSGYVGKKDGFLIKYSFSTEKSERFSMDWLTTARHIRKLISDNKFVSEQSERKEKSFSQQVNDVLAGKADRYNDIKVCDTPQILLEVGCEQLPMLYTQRHLKDALHKKSPKNNHWHGLTKELIKEIPVLISEPAIIFDSISKEPKAQEGIVCVLNKTDNENAPIIVSIKPNGKGIYELEQVDSNFITSIYGKDNGFGKYIERAAVSNQILFWDKQKSQELFSVLGLQLPQGLNNLDFNIIIHQSRNIVKSFEGNKEPTEEKPAPALKVPEQTEPEDKGSASLRKVGDFYEMYGKNAEIGAKVLGLRMLSKNGQPMVGFPDHVKDEYSAKLREAGYSVLIEQAFELNPPKREVEKLQTLQQVVDKFFDTDCESAETERGTWKLAIADGDKVGELFFDGEAVCGIYSRGDKMEIEPYRELTTFPKLLQTAMLEYNHNKPVEIMDFQRTFETPLDKAKYLINDFCEAEYRDEADFSNLHNVSIAYTTLTDDELPIQVTADLVNFKISYEFDGEVFNVEQYDSIEDMVENGLTGLDFSDLVSVPHEVIKRHTGTNEQTVELMSDAADISDSAISWNVIHESDDEKGRPTLWAAQVNSDEFGKYVWIEKSDNGYDVVINNDNDDMVVIESFDFLDDAQNYVEEAIAEERENAPKPITMEFKGVSESQDEISNNVSFEPTVNAAKEKTDSIHTAFETVIANHDFSEKALEFLDRTEKQMRINGYSELDPQMYRLPPFEQTYGRISRINDMLFDGKLKDVIRELNEYIKGESEKNFSQQVDDVLAGKAPFYSNLKVCDTPQILLDVGCEHLPMLYTQKHLKDALMPLNGKKHQHGLTEKQIKLLPKLLEEPVMVFDSLSKNNSVIVVTSERDTIDNPVIISVKPNGSGRYELEQVDSNFITSVYGRNNFENLFRRVVNQDKLLFIDKTKSQDLFERWGEQYSELTNNLDFNIIIHQSRNIVKGTDEKNSNDIQGERLSSFSDPEQTTDLMSDAADIKAISEERGNEPKPITMEFKGVSESLDEISDYALSIGAIVIKNNANGTLSVDTYDNHQEELQNLAYMNGVSCEVKSEATPEKTADTDKKPEKPKSEFASGPVVDGVQVYEALAAEIDRGTGFVHGKLRVQDFYEEQHPTIQELADFLKKEYGIGGHSGEGKISLVDYNSQGITFNFENGEKYRHTWYNVAVMTDARLKDDTYLSAEQKAERMALKAEKPDIPTVKNLSQLKKAIKPGMMFEVTEHLRPECVGERRIVTGVTTVDFTSRKLDDNGEPTGKDIHMEFDRAKNWSFDGGELTSRLDNGDMLMSFHFIESLEREQAVDTDRAFLSQVIEKFGEHYNEMYQNGDQVEGYTEAVAVGDQFIKENPDFMSRLAKQRNDVVSSDRETAALAFALADVGLIEKITEAEKKAEAEAAAPDKSEKNQVVSISEGVAHRNYIALTKMFPEFMKREYSYENLSAGEGFDPLSLEWIGENSFSMMHYYIQNGDVMRDPDIVLTIDDERQAVKSFSYENSSLGAYREYENGSDEQRDCDKFVTNWLRNITAQGYEPVRAKDFNDNEILFNEAEKQQSHSEKQPENVVNVEYMINSGLLGNGITVWNSAKIDKDTNDYETIAHIDTTNRLAYKFYVDDLPEKYKNEVFNIINNAEIQIDKTELVEKSALEFLDLKEHDDGYTVIKEYKYENGEFVLHDYSIKSESSQLTQEDYDILANIKPRKSIMNFDSRDIHLTESWAKHYNAEMDKKSPFYRLENGEWRDSEESKIPVIITENSGADFKKVSEDIKSHIIFRGNVTNADTNWEIQVSRRGLEDTLTYARRHNDNDLYSLIYKVEEIVSQSVLLDTVVTEKNNNNKAFNTAFMHKLYNIARVDDKPYLIKTSIEEFSDGKSDTLKRMYNIQDIQITPIEDKKSSRHAAFIENNQLALSVLNDSTISIANLFSIVKSCDPDFYQNIREQINKERPQNEFGEQLSFNWDFPADNQDVANTAIPFSVGDEIEYENRQYTVEKINESENRIDLLDKNTGWYPITNIQQLDTVIAYYNHYQSKGLVDIEASANKNADNFIATEATEKAQNFVIHDDKLGYGGMKEKYKMNIAAIKLLKELEYSNRQADPEEQEILSRYVGWGGIPNAFDSDDNSWSDEYAELKELLTEDEYESANASVNNAHYTSPIIIRSMYAALDKFGFKGGRILEPACGVGNFIGSAPADKAANYDFTGIELDSISGRIAKQLYPQSNIQVCGFENSRVKDNYFDVAIGNVPFGNYTVTDRKYNKRNHLIHDYFILKSLDLVRPNGVVAVITSSGTMDKSNSKVRREISEKAELIGAIRLPNTAFKQNAGTETVTDILFLQKREIPSTERTSWINTNTTEYLDNSINQYFVDNPDMVCGNIKKISGRFGYKLTVEPFPDKTLEESLAECVSKLSGRIDFTTTQTIAADNTVSDNWELHRNILISDPNMRNHTHTIVADKIYYKKGGRLEEVDVRNFKAKEIDKLKDLIRLGTQARKTVDIQTQDPTMFDSERKELNILYDDFVKKYGFVHSLNGKVKEKWNNDDNNGITLSLEIPDPDDENNYVKNAIFYGRTINTLNEIGHCESVIDALSISLNVKAFVDISFIAQISEKPVEKCIKELNGTFIFRNPEKVRESDINSGWETADEYLSGNVLQKLKIAKAYSHANSDYEVNVSALENVQPERIKAGDISCQLGSSWIPTKYIESFAYECFDCLVTVEHNPITARWQISNKYIADVKEKCTSTYGTSDWNALEIIEQSLNLKDCKVWRVEYVNGEERRVVDIERTEKAANKQDAVKDLFKSWIYKDVHRAEELENIYNEKFNCEAPRSFNGSHLTFPGITNDIELKKHQKDAVARILYGGNTLLAHVVGAGKTFEMTAAAMELKRTGLMEKPLFVVPNNLVGQWQRDFQRLYPASNVLAVSNNDLKGNNRKEFSARIATGNYDAVIMPYSMFNRIEISPERRSDYYKDEIDECISVMDSEDKNSLSVKDAAIRKKKLEAQLEKLEYVQDRDSHVYFEELGIDGLFVDEAHNFKNLYINTKLSRIAGIGNSPSKQAEDLFLKCKYICEKNGSDKGIVFATGTPVSNSMTELYVMEKYLQPSYLKEKGYQHFDSWIADYGEISSAIELSPTGNSFRQKKRCRSFKNLPELMMGYRRCADIQTAEMLNLPIPKKKDDKYTLIITKPSEEQLEFIHECGRRADDVHNKNVSPDQDNMLKITNDGKMCALDMRLVDPQAEDNPNSKVNHCVRAVYAKYKETEQDGLSQVIFLDKSTPDPGKFNLYDDIRDKLVAMGIPKEEIAFVHDAKNSTQKQKLFDDVNSGKVRIIIGSTEKMGAGTNMQEKLCALHHLDVPWRPSDIEQREGRILRQGNTCKEVEIFRYSTEKTFDSYSWQTIENKQKYISQVMTNKPMGRSIEDMDECALNYAEIKSLSTGDERIKQQLELSIDVAKLKSLKSQYESEMIEINKRLKIQYPQEIGKHNSLISDYEKDIELAKSNPKPDDEHFAVKINGTEFTNRKDAGKAVLALRGSVDSIGLDICKYRGFNISLENTGFTSDYGAAIYKLKIKNNSITLTSLGISHEGVFNGIDDVIDTTLNKRLKKHKDKADEIKKNIAEAEARICESFPYEEELKEKTEKLNQLTLALKLNDNSDERNAGLSVNNDDNDNITKSRSR